MRLSGPQRKALYDALLQAFPDRDQLQQWVRLCLDGNVVAHIRIDTPANTVLDLIQNAESGGTTPALLRAAIAASPQNAALRQVAAAQGLAVDIPLDAPSTLPPLRPAVVLSPTEQH